MTIPDLYSNMFNKKPDEIALKWKDNGEWQHKTYAEYKDLIYNVAKSFLKVCNIPVDCICACVIMCSLD